MKENTVQETLLLPLVGRYNANKKWPMYFNEKHSKIILEKFDYDVNARLKKNGFADFCYGLRYNSNVNLAKEYIKKYPKACVVNLGAGLDSLFDDIDNGSIKYYSLDFKEVIELREKYLETSDRNINIIGSIIETDWMDKIDFKEDEGIIFLSAGVFYYLYVDDIKNLFVNIGKRFPKACLTFDSEAPKWMKKSNELVKKNGILDAEMHFMVDNPYDMKNWSNKIKDFRIQKDFSEFIKDRKYIPLLYRLIFWYFSLGENMYQVIVNFE